MGNSNAKYAVSNADNADGKQFPDQKKKMMEKRSNSVISCGPSPYPDFLLKLSDVLEMKSLCEEKCVGIGKETFQKYICKASKTVGKKLFEFFLTKEGLHKEYLDQNEYEVKTLSKDMFTRQAYDLLNCLTDAQQLNYFVKVFANDREEMCYNDFYELISAAYEIAQFAHHTGVLPDTILSAVCKAGMHGKDRTTCKYIFNWISQHCPKLVMWMHRYISHTLTVGYSTIPNDVPTVEEDNVTPVLDSANRSSCATRHPALIWMLSCSLPHIFTKNLCRTDTPEESLQSMRDPHKFIQHLIVADKPSHWIPLYTSDEHGISINRLQHHLFDYHGPTLLFITTDDETMFGVACDEEWRDSKHFYGGHDSMCFQLYPEYKVIEKGAKILYFNITSRGFPTGLHVGADSTNRALTVDINLEMIHYRKIPYKLKSLEAWGCGTTHAKEKQVEYKKQANKDVEKRRQVNVKQEWNDHPDRYLLEMAGARPNYARFEKDTQNHSSLK